MGRVSPSKQNRFGQKRQSVPQKPKRKSFVPTSPLLRDDPELMTQSQFDNRGSAKPERSATNPQLPVQPTNGEVVEAFQSPGVISRGEVRRNANGVVQTGTNTGVKPMTVGDADALLSDGYQVQDPFSSIQLPTTGSSLYQKAPETNA